MSESTGSNSSLKAAQKTVEDIEQSLLDVLDTMVGVEGVPPGGRNFLLQRALKMVKCHARAWHAYKMVEILEAATGK